MEYNLTIKPAIPAEHRHKIEDALKVAGYNVWGGGQSFEMEAEESFSDVSFEDTRKPRPIRPPGIKG